MFYINSKIISNSTQEMQQLYTYVSKIIQKKKKNSKSIIKSRYAHNLE